MRTVLTLAFASLALVSVVRADTYGPLSCQLTSSCGSANWNASAFNVVTLSGNYAESSDIGGRLAVAGNLLGTGSPVLSQGYNTAYTSANALVVNGNIATSNPITVGTSGSQSVYYGGGTPSFNSPTPVRNAVEDFDFVSARTTLQTFSTQTLANYSGAISNPTITDNGTNYVLSVTGKPAGLYVYNVDASNFTNQNRAFEVDLNSNQTVIVNIVNAPANFNPSKGTVINYAGSQVGQTTTGGVPVLFNVTSSSAMTINVGGAWNGSLLAPFATFTGNSSVDGQLFVVAVNAQGEIHDQYFNGNLSSLTGTPEPSTMWMLLGGALGVVLYSRSRSQAN